ncbi:nucleotide exchange factor GrpE [Anabaena sp. FACHB-1237]|nr:nucleotide exchange factor GrpE [Anabaena sp. FACHB-1237]
MNILGKREVFTIELEIGREPDFNVCCVLDREETKDLADQTITKIVRRGFQWQEKFIRPPEVITAKSPPFSPPQTLTENI